MKDHNIVFQRVKSQYVGSNHSLLILPFQHRTKTYNLIKIFHFNIFLQKGRSLLKISVVLSGGSQVVLDVHSATVSFTTHYLCLILSSCLFIVILFSSQGLYINCTTFDGIHVRN